MARSKNRNKNWPSISTSTQRRTFNFNPEHHWSLLLLLCMLLHTSASFRIASQFRPIATTIHKRTLFTKFPFHGDIIPRRGTVRNKHSFFLNPPLMTTTISHRTKRKLSQMSSTCTESNADAYKPLVIILAGPTAVVRS